MSAVDGWVVTYGWLAVIKWLAVINMAWLGQVAAQHAQHGRSMARGVQRAGCLNTSPIACFSTLPSRTL
jgi:hypothetical protein